VADSMDRQIDPKTRFYLERRQQIEEWGALSGGAKQLSDQLFDELADRLGELARSSELKLVDVWTGRWRVLAFTEADRDVEQDGTPAAAVTVSWGKSTFPDDSKAVSVGVRVSHGPRDHMSTHQRILGATAERRTGRPFKTSSWWPFWEYVSAPEARRWWDDPDPFVELVEETARGHLEDFAEIVRLVLGPAEGLE
jgi:hypothetical protein